MNESRAQKRSLRKQENLSFFFAVRLQTSTESPTVLLTEVAETPSRAPPGDSTTSSTMPPGMATSRPGMDGSGDFENLVNYEYLSKYVFGFIKKKTVT